MSDMVYWKCDKCYIVESTSAYAQSVVHIHDSKAFSLEACDTYKEAADQSAERNGHCL